jgi:hypothetical protein
LVENYPCNNREELCKREGEIIRLIGTLNSNIAGRDKMLYYIDNADKIKEQHKIYDEARKHNPDRIQQKKRVGGKV